MQHTYTILRLRRACVHTHLRRPKAVHGPNTAGCPPPPPRHLHPPVALVEQGHAQVDRLQEDGVRGAVHDELNQQAGQPAVVEEALHLLQAVLDGAKAHCQILAVREKLLLRVHR